MMCMHACYGVYTHGMLYTRVLYGVYTIYIELLIPLTEIELQYSFHGEHSGSVTKNSTVRPLVL